MAMRVVILLGAVLTLAACESRLNPWNWFGNAREERVAVEAAPAVPEDPRGLVDQVQRVSVDRLPTGAVVTAIGIPPRQGYWEAELVEVGREGGNLVLEFRIAEPITPTDVGSPRSREVYAAFDLSNHDLAEIRQITVEGARNRMISGR
ncbi:hypothetical protein HKCCE2091_18810 [Rhodobacterales bacterium HKCCE2091]|nr:hypothetical protein [Rhodobacterales bacterium HKCCE2091]